MRGAREARQNEHAGIFGILRGDVLLRDEVHSVAKRSHEADPSHPVESGEGLATDRPVHVTDRVQSTSPRFPFVQPACSAISCCIRLYSGTSERDLA